MRSVIHFIVCPGCLGWGYGTSALDPIDNKREWWEPKLVTLFIRAACHKCNGHGWISHRTVTMAMMVPEKMQVPTWLKEEKWCQTQEI